MSEETQGAHPMMTQVEAVLEEMRPMLHADGGDIDLVSIEEGVVNVRLRGACAGWPAAATTLYEGIAKVLEERVPGVRGIVPVP